MPTDRLRLGLTLRVADGPHGETRDALAHDWYRCVAHVWPGAEIVLLPNLGESIAGQLADLDLSGVILTGGNSLSMAPIRDETESAILNFALDRPLPVFGVCRGLQMIQHHLGGEIVDCDSDFHAGTRHAVELSPELAELAEDGVVVNSYHDQGVPQDRLAKGLLPLATCDGLVEAVAHETLPLTAVQWHPEREATPSRLDCFLMRRTLCDGLLRRTLGMKI